MLCTRCWTDLKKGTFDCPRCGQRLSPAPEGSGPTASPPPTRRSTRIVWVAFIGLTAAAAFALAAIGGSLRRPSRAPASVEESPSSERSPSTAIEESSLGKSVGKKLQNELHAEEPDIVALNEEGVRLYNAARYADALDRFHSALLKRPDDLVLKKNAAFAMGNLGWTELKASRPEAALRAFQEAALEQPKEAIFHFGAGMAYHRMGEDERAVRAIEEGLALDPDQPEGLKLLGEIDYLGDDLDAAITAWERALKRQPGDGILRERLAKAVRERAAQQNFRAEETRHFVLKFDGPEREEAAREIIEILEQAYQDVGGKLSAYPRDPVTVILYSSEQFRDVTRTPDWAGGVFDGKIRLPIGAVPAAVPAGRQGRQGTRLDPALLRRVLYHEYTHAVVYTLAARGVPTWVNEGLALIFEGEEVDRSRDVAGVRAAFERGELPALSHLEESFLALGPRAAQAAYAESFSAVRYMVDRYGMFRVRQFLEALGRGTSVDAAMSENLYISYGEFEKAWIRSLS